MKKKCFSNANCPLARAYQAIGDWWSLLILSTIILASKRRFGDIQERLGMAKNILTARLTKLVRAGILKKVPASDGTNYSEYAPTEKGEDLLATLVALRQWGERHFFKEGECTNNLVSRERKDSIPRIVVRDALGKILKGSELEIIEPKH